MRTFHFSPLFGNHLFGIHFLKRKKEHQMADDAADTVASVLAQAFTLYEKSIKEAKAAFKKTVVDDRQTQTVVFPLDVMVTKQELYVFFPPLPPEPSPPASPPSSPLSKPLDAAAEEAARKAAAEAARLAAEEEAARVAAEAEAARLAAEEEAARIAAREAAAEKEAARVPPPAPRDYKIRKARSMALWELNYRTRPCENPEFVSCGLCSYGGKCRFFHTLSHRRRPPTDAEIDELANKYYLALSTRN